MHGLHLASSNFADPAALQATPRTPQQPQQQSSQQRMASTPNNAAASASSSSSGSAATPSAGSEKSESRGFFSKLFGRNKSTTATKANTAAGANTPNAANTQTTTEAPPNAGRARSGAASSASASAAVAATAPAAAASFRFPASLAGDRLEGLWRAWSSSGIAASSTSGASGSSSGSSARSAPHGVAEAKALLAALEEVEREWAAEPPKNRAAMVSPNPASSPSATPRAATVAQPVVDPLSSLPLFRPSLHGSHGHPSALVRRLAQDFTQHTANSLPEQLATFIAQQQLSTLHSDGSPQSPQPDLSPEADPDAPPPTLEQQLDQAPMFVLLQIIQHLLLYTNNRLILQSTDFFSWLIKLTAMLANEYLTVPTPATPIPAADPTSPNSPSAAQLHWARERQQPFFSTSLLLTYLHLQMQRCFMCIQLWLDDGQSWRRRDMYTLSSTASDEQRVSSPSLKLPPGSDQDQMLLRDALFQLFVHLHPHLIQRLHSPAMAAAALSKSHGSYTPPPSVIPPFFPLDLYQSILHLFGALACGNSNNQEIFLQHSLHRRMLELIGAKFEDDGTSMGPASPGAAGTQQAGGWTDAQQQQRPLGSMASPLSSPGSASSPSSPSASSLSPSPSFRWRWFSTQIWALEVLREVCFAGAPPGFTLEFVKNAGVERVLEMMLWTFRAFSGGNTQGTNAKGSAPMVERTAAATPAQIAAVQGLLSSRAEEEKREMATEEDLHLAASMVPGSWMRSVSAALLRPENNPRCNTIYASSGCIVPASLLQSAPELHMLFNVLLSMCCMDLHADASSPASPGPSPPAGRGVRSPVSPASAAVPAFNVSFLLLQMVLDLFNPEIAPMPYNQRARVQLGLTVSGSPSAAGGVQLHLPILQLQTLALFHRLLLYKPALLSFVRTYNVYHTLFSASFFFLSQVSSSAAAAAAAAPTPTPSSSPPPSVDDQLEGSSPREVRSPEPVTTPQQHEALVSRLMRTSVLDLMAYFATLHGQAQVGSASPLAAPAAELSYLLSLLYQRYTSPSLVQQLCVVIKRVWQHRRLECEAALQQLCWQAHLASVPDPAVTRGSSASAAASAAAAAAVSSAARPMDPFKQFSKLLAFFHQAMLPSAPSSPSHAAFLSMLETLLQGLPAQLLALREHGFVWSCFSMVESKDPRRRRSGIRMTIALVCAVGAAPDMLPALHAPPAILQAMGQQVGPPDLASASAAAAPATPSRSSRARSGSMEDDSLGTPSGESMSKDSAHGGVANASLYSHEEIQKVARVLLTKYIELFPAHCTPSLAVLTDLAFGLHGLLTRHSRLHQDLCRRRHIFVQLMHILSHLGNAQVIIEEPATPIRGAASMASPQALPRDQSYSISNAGGEGVSQLDRPTASEGASGEEGHDAANFNSVRTRSSPSAVIVASPGGAAGASGAGPLGMPLMIRSQTDSAVPSSLSSISGSPHSSALTLLLSLLRCLTLLLNNNLRSKEVFRKNIGNDLLAKLIHKIVVRETRAEMEMEDNHAVSAMMEAESTDEQMDGGSTPAERCMRAIYGEIFRALLEREWADIAAFERGFDSAALEGAVQPMMPVSPIDGDQHRIVHSSSSAIPNRVYVFNSRSPPALLDCMLLQVLALQKSLLIPTPFLPEHESQLSGGFLVCEDDLTSLRQFLENHGSILAVFGPSAVASALAPPPAAIQPAGSQGLPLIAYMLLSPLSEFEAPFAMPNPQCTLDLLVPRAEWNAFTSVSREQKRYIKQVGVVRDGSMRGAGTMLLRVAQSIYPRGLLSSVLAGPPPFVNIRSLRYFSDPARGNFKQVGWDIVAAGAANGYPPALSGGFQCEVLQWSAEQESAAALARGYGKAAASSSMGSALPLKASSSFPMPQIVAATSEVRVEGPKRYTSASPSPPLNAPYVGDTSFVWIQNPDVIPLLFSPHLFLLAPLAVQRDVLSLFTKLVSTSLLNQSHACKVLLIDLLLDLFPHLPPLQAHADELVSLQRSFLNLIQIVGTHSISVKQLKRFFALMKSTPIRVPKEWIRMNVNQHLQAQLVAAASAEGKGVEGGPPSSPSARDAWHSRESSASIPLAPPRTPSSSNVAAAVAASSMGSFDDAASVAASDSEILEVLVRPWYGPLLLGAIEAMTSKSGPQDYWFLDGLSSGLTIPPLDRWPAKQGWAFSAWIRIESYEQPRMPEHVSSNAALTDLDEPAAANAASSSSAQASFARSYQPRLFHFSSSPTGPFLESYFDTRGHLTLACSLTAGGPVQTQAIDFKLAPQTWYHVAMSQNVASTFGSSELIVWIDAQCVHTSSTMKYPAIPKQLSFCFVGTNQASSPLGGLSSTAPMPSSSAAGAIQALYGQLGPFYFFDEPVSSLQVGLMYALGPSYMFTFAPDTISVNASTKTIGGQGVDNMLPNNPPPRGGAGKQQPPSITVTSASTSAATAASLTASLGVHARNLSSKIFLAYNSKARDGHLFLDNTPRAKRGSSHATASSRKRGMHAVALVGTYQCSTRHVAHVLTCLGGVSVLFPLLAQLDQPIHRERPVGSPIAENPSSSPMGSPAAAAVEGEADNQQMIVEGGGEEGGQSGEGSVPVTPDTRKTNRRMRSPPVSSPTSPAAVKRKLRSSSGQGIVAPHSELVYEVDRRFLVNFLHVLAVMLRQEANQTYMLSIHGFSVVGAQLELANPRHFTVKAVQALQRLVLGVRNHDILFRHAFAAFFTNLKLWIYAKPPVQRFWLCVTQEFVATYPALLNHALAMPTMQQMQPLLGKGTQHLLDRLRGVCWFNPNDVDGVGASAGGPAAAVSRSYLLHPVTQQVIGMRPSAANLREIRGELLRTLHDTLSIPPIGVSLPDIKAIVLFLQCCGGGCAGVGASGGPLGDEAQIEDILWLFIQLMEKQSIVVLKYLAELDDLSFMSAAASSSSSSSSASVTVSTPQPQLPVSNPSSAAAGPIVNSVGGAALEGSVSPLLTPTLNAAALRQPKYHYDSMRRAGMDIFLDLLYSTSSVRVRTLALRGLAKLLRSGSITSTTLQSEMFLVIEYSLCGGLDGGRVVRPPPQPFLADMVAAGAAASQAHWQPSASARRREWDESTYFALLSLMLGVHIDADNIREVRTSLLLEGATILHTSALAILLKLCAFHSAECTPGPSLLEIILQDMMFLLNHTTVNIKLCMDHVGWQEWFVQIMQDKQASSAVLAAAANATSTTATPAGSAPGRSPVPIARANAMLHSFDGAAAQPHAIDDSNLGVHPPSHAAASASHHGRYNTLGPNSKQPPELSLSPEGVSNGGDPAASPAAAAAVPSASVAAGSPSIRPSVSSPLSPSPHSEHVQSSINAQSYATSLFEQLLLHSLKKPSGYKHFDRMVIYLTFFMHPPMDSATTTTGGSTGSSAALLPRSDIPVLQFLLPVLQDLNQLLRRESETISQLDLGLLVDNIVHVLERTQDVLLERVAFHAHMHTVMRKTGGAEGRRAHVDESGEAPANMSACAHELSAVWPLVEVMMVLNAWLVLFAPAHAAFKQSEREKEQARRGYISLLGSAAVGAVKGAAGAVTSATNATYRAIHDAFDMMNEPNVPTPAPAPVVAPVVVDESPAADNEMLFFAQLVTRIAMCFEQPEERQREEEEAAAEEEEGEDHFAQKPEGAPHQPHDPEASPSMVQLLFHGEGGAQLCAILSFITSQERAYTVKLASALRSSPHASFSVPPTTPSVPGAASNPMPVPSNSVATPSAMPSTMMSAGAGGGGWMAPATPGVGGRLYSSASISSFGPVSPMGFSRQSSLGGFASDGTGGPNEADALHYLYTLLCTMLDTLASREEGASFSPAGPRFGSNAALVCPFVLLLSETIRNLHASSVAMLSDNSVSGSPSTLHAAWDAELEELNGAIATPRKGGGGGGSSSSSGPSIPPPLVTIPNPSASFLPALPPLSEQCLGHANANPPNFGAALEHLMFDPNWLSLLQQLRPLVQSVQDQAYGAHASRVSSLHRLGAKIRETHLRTVLNEQMPILLDSLSLVTALSHRNAAAETVRYNGMKRRRLRMARRRMGTWLWMVRNLTNERGPWSQNGSHGSTTTSTFKDDNGAMVKKDGSASSSSVTVGKRIYWKLDETENSSRMRMKLKINYRGHDHHQASHDYVAPIVSRPASSKNLALLDTNDEEGSTSGALSTLGLGGTGGEDLFAAAILFSKSAMGVLAPQLGRDGRPAGAGSTNTEAEEDWDLMDGGVGGKGAAKGKANDKGTSVGAAVALAAAQALTVVDTDVELITFRARITGRFMLTSTHLFFEARDDVVMISAAAKARRKDKSGRKGGAAGAAAAPVAESPSVSHDRSWLISHICAVHFRRHQLRRNAIEIFFHDHTCAFFAFASETVRNTIHTKLLRVIRPYVRIQQQKLIASTGGSHGGVSSRLAHMGFVYAGSSGNYGIGGPWGGNAFDVIRKSGLVTAWRNRKISNFQYLMHLNTIAGRTYNDLTQYPVFPWVLADYTSSHLDLDDPTNESGVFRDLTKPIGALNPQRLKMFLDRYHSLDDPEMPAFMYGTHYSSSGTVLFYLLRMEPFTTAAIELQGGKFEHADRMFSSVAACWAGVTSNAADVKELTPEFFYLPDFLRNSSGIDFGTKQRGEKIDDVILPPWANGSADEFVRLNRAALESEYVSLNLHHWIDLIFGFKQLGRAAVEAHNVFFHLTYEGGVDIDRIEDQTVRDATIAQIEHFGQTPSQLFSSPHPMRIRQQEQAENEIPTLFQQLRQLQALQASGSSSSSSSASHHSDAQRLMLQLYTVEQVTATAATENPLLFLALLPGTDRLLTVALDRVMALHKFKNTIQEYIPPFLLEIDKKAAGASNTKTNAQLVVAGATGQPAYAATMPTGGMLLPSSSGSSSGSGAAGGGLGSALSFMSSGGKNGSASGRRVGVHFTVGLNILPFFFLVSADQRFLLSCGHWDNSFRVTAVDSGENVHSCSAHKDIVTCLAISDAGDFVVTGSKDTTVCVWQVASHVIDMASHPAYANRPGGSAAAAAAVSAAASGELYLLESPLHVLHGHDDEVTSVAASSELDVVVSGSRDGTVMLHSLRTGRYTRTISPPDGGPIRWVGVSAQGRVLSYSLMDLMLHAWSINGNHLGSCDTNERLYAMRFSADGEFLLAGGDRKQLTVYDLCAPGGAPAAIHRLPPADATIRSIEMTAEEQHVLIGTATGKLYVYGLNADYLRKRFLKRLAHLGL